LAVVGGVVGAGVVAAGAVPPGWLVVLVDDDPADPQAASPATATKPSPKPKTFTFINRRLIAITSSFCASGRRIAARRIYLRPQSPNGFGQTQEIAFG
jgi:hypothetical protein